MADDWAVRGLKTAALSAESADSVGKILLLFSCQVGEMLHHNIPLSEEASETKRRWMFQRRIGFNGRIHIEDEREGKQGNRISDSFIQKN